MARALGCRSFFLSYYHDTPIQMLASENNVDSFDYAEWTESRVIKTHAWIHNSQQ